MQDQALQTFYPIWILGFNVYVFLLKEKQNLKSANQEEKALKNKLFSFNG